MTTQAKTGHTPGPWKVEDNGYPIEIWSGTGQTDGLQVCRIGGTGDCPEEDAENQANARLIAAAPAIAKELRRAKVLLRLLTIRQIISAGDDAIDAAGLNPWCINEGADGDAKFSPWSLDAILAQIDGEEGDDHA